MIVLIRLLIATEVASDFGTATFHFQNQSSLILKWTIKYKLMQEKMEILEKD